jgi:hypothetical protein
LADLSDVSQTKGVTKQELRHERANFAQLVSFPATTHKLLPMSTITAILEPHADGSLHLPLPPEMRHGKVRVEAKLEALPASSDQKAGSPDTTPLEAFKALRALGGLRHVIPDPVAWQREQRTDRSLPGRE